MPSVLCVGHALCAEGQVFPVIRGTWQERSQSRKAEHGRPRGHQWRDGLERRSLSKWTCHRESSGSKYTLRLPKVTHLAGQLTKPGWLLTMVRAIYQYPAVSETDKLPLGSAVGFSVSKFRIASYVAAVSSLSPHPPLPSFPLLPPLPIHLENKNQSIELKAYSVLYIHNFFISLKPHMVVLTPSPNTSHSRWCAYIFLPLFDILILRNDSSFESSSGCCKEDPSLSPR